MTRYKLKHRWGDLRSEGGVNGGGESILQDELSEVEKRIQVEIAAAAIGGVGGMNSMHDWMVDQ